jgi:oligopeptide/dipeptide ABC transporter ATP-binding protein
VSLLEVEGLTVQIRGEGGTVTIVDGVDYKVEERQIFGVAGESGSGKTMSVLALLQLLPRGAQTSGRATYRGRDLLTLSGRGLQQVRGRELAMVFQDPLTSLHPMMTIGRQLSEHVRYHEGLSKSAALARAQELLGEVRLPDPERALDAFPHQFSGGMRQRVAIASALATRPKLLIADEPTTALDVTVQAGILRLLDRLRREHGLSVILITHDLGVLSSIADQVSIFYAGRIVESGPTRELLGHPRHPYTRALLDALPHPEAEGRAELQAIPGLPPSPRNRPSGCAFHPRCAFALPACAESVPPFDPVSPTRRLACPPDPFSAAA